MISDKDVEKLKGVFATAQDYTHLEDRVDTLVDTVNGLTQTVEGLSRTTASLSETVQGLAGFVSNLPTKENIENMLERMYNLSVLKAEHDRMKAVIREQLHVEV